MVTAPELVPYSLVSQDSSQRAQRPRPSVSEVCGPHAHLDFTYTFFFFFHCEYGIARAGPRFRRALSELHNSLALLGGILLCSDARPLHHAWGSHHVRTLSPYKSDPGFCPLSLRRTVASLLIRASIPVLSRIDPFRPFLLLTNLPTSRCTASPGSSSRCSPSSSPSFPLQYRHPKTWNWRSVPHTLAGYASFSHPLLNDTDLSAHRELGTNLASVAAVKQTTRDNWSSLCPRTS